MRIAGDDGTVCVIRPDPKSTVTFEEHDEDSDATKETEAFLAGLMEDSYADKDEGYLSPDNVPVRAYANMLSSDDIWILSTGKSGKDVVPDLQFHFLPFPR
jgi:hypothetical protein